MQALQKIGFDIPLKKAIPCGYCPRLIFKEQEPNGKLRLVNGRPMCVVCRAVNFSRTKNQVLGDHKIAERDFDTATKLQEAEEMNRVADIASQSVELTNTQNKELRDKKGIV